MFFGDVTINLCFMPGSVGIGTYLLVLVYWYWKVVTSLS